MQHNTKDYVDINHNYFDETSSLVSASHHSSSSFYHSGNHQRYHLKRIGRIFVKIFSQHLLFFLCCHPLHHKLKRNNHYYRSKFLDYEFGDLRFNQKLAILLAFVAVTMVNCYFTFLLTWTRHRHCSESLISYKNCERTYGSVESHRSYCTRNKRSVYDSRRGYYPKGALFHYPNPINYNFTTSEDEVIFATTANYFTCFPYCSKKRENHEDHKKKPKYECHASEKRDVWCAYPNQFIFLGCQTKITNTMVTIVVVVAGLIVFYPVKILSRLIIMCTTGRGKCANAIGRVSAFVVYSSLIIYILGICAIYVVLIGLDLIPFIPARVQLLNMLWKFPIALGCNFIFDAVAISMGAWCRSIPIQYSIE